LEMADAAIGDAIFTAAQVAQHASASDCWVAVHGRVYDVTNFLAVHPGGASALSKLGRAGCDVTEHFERIGHSADARTRLETMFVGTLDNGNSRGDAASRSVDDHAVDWHGRRRMAILKAHPEVAELIGSNPWTPLLGLLAGAVHAATALACGWYLGLFPSFVLAYSVGAVCKMVQFAVCHDICHGTAGAWLRPYATKNLAYHIVTLPSFSGETHQFYAYQHIGHHASLGRSPLRDFPVATPPAELPVAEPAAAELGGGSQPSEKTGPLRIVRFDELDGDLPAASSMLLLVMSSEEIKQVSQELTSFVGRHGNNRPLARADGARADADTADGAAISTATWQSAPGGRDASGEPATEAARNSCPSVY